MLQDIWDWFLSVTQQFVMPDWGKLISLLPVGIAVLVAIWLVSIVRRIRGAPKAQRGKHRIAPRTPAGIHMPGPSFAPIFAAVGAALTLLGLVFGGAILWLGILALVLTLLYWLAEGIRLYDRDVGPTAPSVPAVIHDGPPPGVHMPGPSFRPIVGAIGVAMLMLGLVFGEWLLFAGVLALVLTLVGWLVDAVREYRRTVEADRTGHLDNGPAPRTPSVLLATLLVLLIGATVLQTGIIPVGEASGAGPTPSASAAPSGEPSGAPSGPPSSEAPPTEAPTGDVTITAEGLDFVEDSVTAPADRPFTIVFHNNAAGLTHNVELKDASGKGVFVGEPFPGPETRVYDVPAQPAGAYTFICTIHPDMTGTATIG